jgi:FAD/FMN-containing dehydrogenase
LLDRTFLDLAGPSSAPVALDGVEALLLVDVEGPDAATVAGTIAEAEATIRPRVVAARTGLDAASRQALWAIRHGASPALASLPEHRRSLQVIEDGCVPVSRLGAYLDGLRTASDEVGIPLVVFGHAGDGHLHVNALVDTGWTDLATRLTRLLETVTRLVVSLGGTPSGEHGDGRVRAPGMTAVYGSTVAGLFAEVKHAFDPVGMFNPGVIVPTGPPLAHLKVGAAAAPIPEDVAAALRARERAGRWDRAPLTLLDGPA